jgi:hypothetical protein
MVKEKNPLDAMFESIDNTLGPVEELSSDEVRSFLADAKVDTTALKRRLYERGTELRGVYWGRNVDEPAHLKDFIEQLRPVDAKTADPEQQRLSAHKWFKQLFERVPIGDESSIGYAFHRRTDNVSQQDETSLQELAERLKKKLEKGQR